MVSSTSCPAAVSKGKQSSKIKKRPRASLALSWIRWQQDWMADIASHNPWRYRFVGAGKSTIKIWIKKIPRSCIPEHLKTRMIQKAAEKGGHEWKNRNCNFEWKGNKDGDVGVANLRWYLKFCSTAASLPIWKLVLYGLNNNQPGEENGTKFRYGPT